MRRILFVAVSLLVIGTPLRSQVETSNLKVRVILVDKDLNQKPVPHLAVLLVADSSDPGSPHELKTDFEGKAEFQAPTGKYRLNTPQGVDFQGRHYAWETEINVSDKSTSVDLSNDNARVSDLPAAESARKADDLT